MKIHKLLLVFFSLVTVSMAATPAWTSNLPTSSIVSVEMDGDGNTITLVTNTCRYYYKGDNYPTVTKGYERIMAALLMARSAGLPSFQIYDLDPSLPNTAQHFFFCCNIKFLKRPITNWA